MNFYFSAILSLCIAIPAIIGLVRFSKINEAYYPFIFCLWLGTLNEVISIAIVMTNRPNTINGNIYTFLESILLTWQFQKWNFFDRKNKWFKITVVFLTAFWIVENFIISKITVYNSYFSIIYSALITFMSISTINHLIVTERKSLLKNSIFILCSAFVLFYTLNVLSETFWLYGINESFRKSVYHISVITNFIAIILYSFSVLWMPIKQQFTLPSS